MAEEQQLNSLARFRKQSDHLVLEAYSHCEVPAGCGGVVLRWRNPGAVIPLILSLYTPIAADCFIDGTPLTTSQLDLVPGTHVLAVDLPEVDLSAGLIMFAAVHQTRQEAKADPSPVGELPLSILSANDGTWKFIVHEPPDASWTALAFDDQAWPALTTAPLQLDTGQFGSYQARHCESRGAACLGLPGVAAERPRVSWWISLLGWQPPDSSVPTHGRVWIRKVFDIPPAPAGVSFK
jgi:hypothetical protein